MTRKHFRFRRQLFTISFRLHYFCFCNFFPFLFSLARPNCTTVCVCVCSLLAWWLGISPSTRFVAFTLITVTQTRTFVALFLKTLLLKIHLRLHDHDRHDRHLCSATSCAAACSGLHSFGIYCSVHTLAFISQQTRLSSAFKCFWFAFISTNRLFVRPFISSLLFSSHLFIVSNSVNTLILLVALLFFSLSFCHSI